MYSYEWFYIIVISCSFVTTYYDRIKDYFAIDPLILKLFAYLCPKRDFDAFCVRVPPYLSIDVLVNRALQPVRPEVSRIHK
jgi:hypothetical protein